MRDRNDEISALGATIVAVGTGDRRYAEGFVRDERIPFTVLVDDDAAAATAASVETLSWAKLMHPKTWKATRETSKRGYHIHKAGRRVRQIGATFVVAPGDDVRFAHLDADSTDHAPVEAVLVALR